MHFLGLSGMPRRIPDFPDALVFGTLLARGFIINCIWDNFISSRSNSYALRTN